MKFNDFIVGVRTFILAEIGNNHNGDFETATKLIEEAAKAGADGVKFQTFNPDLFVDKSFPILSNVKGVHRTQYERLKSIQLSKEQYLRLKNVADELGIVFSSTPLDEESADFLDDMVSFFKIASGDLTNIPLLKHISEKGKPVVLSTGMGSEAEIEKAIDLFPKDNLILLHCVARYPTPLDEANMLSIQFLKECFKVPVGYSDHTIGTTACKVAVSLGSAFIEKHFTLDKDQAIGDHQLSADPSDLSQLVKDIREIEKTLGVYGKPVENQKNAAKVMRRSLYARTDIRKGELITKEKVVPLRPSGGIPPGDMDRIVGKTSLLDIKEGICLKPEMFSN